MGDFMSTQSQNILLKNDALKATSQLSMLKLDPEAA
jgi:hypothetical protein